MDCKNCGKEISKDWLPIAIEMRLRWCQECYKREIANKNNKEEK